MWDTYVSVDDADETATKVREAGGSIVKEPFDVMGSGRMAVFADPEGARSASGRREVQGSERSSTTRAR